MGFWDTLTNGTQSRPGASTVLPQSYDEFSAPATRNPTYDYRAPSAPRGGTPSSQQDVWNYIAARHPRKFAKALAYVKWLERMERRAASKIL